MKKNEKTLNEFINTQIHRFSLSSDNKTRKKIRTKLIRTMTQPKASSYFQGKNIWKNAQTITINGAKTKILPNDALLHLAEETQNYFENLSIKHGGLTAKDFKELKNKNMQHYHLALEFRESYDFILDDKKAIQNMYENYSQKVMLKAIFEHFYTPLNETKIKQDLSTLYYEAEPIEFSTDPTILSINNRLSHPENNYYKSKNIKN